LVERRLKSAPIAQRKRCAPLKPAMRGLFYASILRMFVCRPPCADGASRSPGDSGRNACLHIRALTRARAADHPHAQFSPAAGTRAGAPTDATWDGARLASAAATGAGRRTGAGPLGRLADATDNPCR
jgi:hypothetical protein